MSNQTIAAVPFDVTDTVSLKRFFRELVDNLNTVLGYTGTEEGYVSTKEQAQTLVNIRQTLQDLLESKDEESENIADIKESLEALVAQVDSQNVLSAKAALGSDYYDFNNVAWDNLAGPYTLSTDGANLLNTPFTASAGTVYDVFINAFSTGSDSHCQITVGKTAPVVYARWGVAGAWVQLG